MSRALAAEHWIRPGAPALSIRAATRAARPMRVYLGAHWLATMPVHGPQCMPTRRRRRGPAGLSASTGMALAAARAARAKRARRAAWSGCRGSER